MQVLSGQLCRTTYGCILGGFRSAALEGLSVALVLEALWGDETLDLRGLLH